MIKRNYSPIEDVEKVAYDIDELAYALSLGKNKAMEIGVSSGAKFNVGKRVLYSRKRIEEWVEEQLNN